MRRRYESLVDMQTRTCTLFAGSRLFGVSSDGTYEWTTYDAFGHDVDGCRGALSKLGIRAGDRVAVLASNSVRWATVAFAVFGLGAVQVPISTGLPDPSVDLILRDSGARLVFAGSNELYARLMNLKPSLPALERVLHLDDAQRLEDHETHAPRVRPVRDDAATILYTSGTTGRPKGVVLSHGNIVSNVNAVHQVFDITPDDVSCALLPWAHAFGQTCDLYCMMSGGASIALPEEGPTVTEHLQRIRPTILFAVPAVWNAIYDRVQRALADASGAKRALYERGLMVARRRRNAAANHDRSFRLDAEYTLFNSLLFDEIRDDLGGRLRYALSGGAALARPVAQLIEDIGIDVYEGYGLTETSPLVTTNTPDARRLGTVGRPIPGVDVFVCDPEGRVLPAGVEGELVVVGPNVMLGYHNDRATTEAAIFDLDGLRAFRTGDLGVQSPAGFVTVTGRTKEQFKLADGTYLAPGPIEQQMELSPWVAQAFVYGDHRPTLVALVVPARELVEAWALEHDLGAKTWRARLAQPEVCAHLNAAVCACFETWEGVRPTAWRLLPEPFTIEAGELTPKHSLRRSAIAHRYCAVLESLYDEPAG